LHQKIRIQVQELRIVTEKPAYEYGARKGRMIIALERFHLPH